jgi:hypothetical protein
MNPFEEMANETIDLVTKEGGASGATKGFVIGAVIVGLPAAAFAMGTAGPILAAGTVAGLVGGIFGASRGSKKKRQ